MATFCGQILLRRMRAPRHHVVSGCTSATDQLDCERGVVSSLAASVRGREGCRDAPRLPGRPLSSTRHVSPLSSTVVNHCQLPMPRPLRPISLCPIKLTKAYEASGFTKQTAIATAADISLNSFVRACEGLKIQRGTAVSIANALKVSLEDLLPDPAPALPVQPSPPLSEEASGQQSPPAQHHIVLEKSGPEVASTPLRFPIPIPTQPFSTAVFDSLPLPVFMKDRNGVYVNCNEHYADFVGKQKKDVINTVERSKLDEQLFDNPLLPQIYQVSVHTWNGVRQILCYKAAYPEGPNPDGIVGILVDLPEVDEYRSGHPTSY